MPYKPNHLSEYYHCIIRFATELLVTSVETAEIVSKFEQLRSKFPCIIVQHNGLGPTHYHILYKHYKGSPRTHYIKAWAEKWKARVWWRLAGYPALLREYLLQGGGREIVYENPGVSFSQIGKTECAMDRGWQEEIESICEPGKWDCNEPRDEENITSSKRNRGPGNAGGVYARGQEQQLGVRLDSIITKHLATDMPGVFRLLMRDGSEEDKNWWLNAALHSSFNTTFINAMALIKLKVKDYGYEVTARMKEYDSSIYYTIEQSLAWLKKTLVSNGINPLAFAKDVIDICLMRSGKKNCFYMIGKPNCGKTTIEQSISDGFMFPTTVSLLTDMSSGFALQELVKADMVVFNEPAISGKQIEQIKNIFEGNKFYVGVKYKDNEAVVRLPVVCTTNKDIWVYCEAAAPAIRARCFRYEFTVEAPSRTKKLHPLIWLTLAEQNGWLNNIREDSEDIQGISAADFATIPTSSTFSQDSTEKSQSLQRRRKRVLTDFLDPPAKIQRTRNEEPYNCDLVYGIPRTLKNPNYGRNPHTEVTIIFIPLVFY